MSFRISVSGAAADAVRRTVPGLVSRPRRERHHRTGRRALGSRGRGRVGEAPRLDRGGRRLPAARPRDPRPPRAARAPTASATSCSAAWAARRSLPRSSPARRGVDLTVLDSTEPGQVLAALGDRLEASALVVSSKSGSTVETDSQRRVYEQAFRDAGIDPAKRIIVVTDPGSPLDDVGTRRRLPRVQRRPERRWPLLGADRLRPRAVGARRRRHRRAPRRGRDDRALARDRQPREPRPRARRGDRRARPAARQARHRGRRHPHRRLRRLGRAAHRRVDRQAGHRHPARRARQGRPRARRRTCPTSRSCDSSTTPATRSSADHDTGEIRVSGTPRRAAARLGVRDRRRRPHPRHQPVRPARRRVREDRRPRPARRPPRARARRVRRRTASRCAARPRSSARRATSSRRSTCCSRSCPRTGTSRCRHTSTGSRTPSSPRIRDLLAARSGRPVTFGWGPRFLHSTGQFHKGGPAVGVFLQITQSPVEDLAIPERPFTFGQLIAGPGTR